MATAAAAQRKPAPIQRTSAAKQRTPSKRRRNQPRPPAREVRAAIRAYKKKWQVINMIVDDLLDQAGQTGIGFYEVYKAAEEAELGPIRVDLIPCSLMGGDYLIDCRSRTIYRA